MPAMDLIEILENRLGRKLKFELKATMFGEWYCDVAVAPLCYGRSVGKDKYAVICKAICDALILEDKRKEEQEKIDKSISDRQA